MHQLVSRECFEALLSPSCSCPLESAFRTPHELPFVPIIVFGVRFLDFSSHKIPRIQKDGGEEGPLSEEPLHCFSCTCDTWIGCSRSHVNRPSGTPEARFGVGFCDRLQMALT